MIPDNFSSVLSFVQSNGYFLIFLLMVIEGPLVTTAAAFAASLGYFNIWIIFALSFLGNFIPDLFFFFIGKFGRKGFIEKILIYFKLNRERIGLLENGMKKHAGKTIIFAKITPFLPIPGIILAGLIQVPTKKFLKIVLIFNIVSTIFFIIVGFYSGLAFDRITKYLKLGEYSLLILVILIVVAYFAYKKLLSTIKI